MHRGREHSGLIVSLLLPRLSSSRSLAGRHVKCVHACMRACMPCSGAVHVHTARRPPHIAGATCTARLGAACSGVREPHRAIIMAAVDTPSLSPVSNASLDRTNERSQLRSLAIIIFSAARKDAHTSERAQNMHTCANTSEHARLQLENAGVWVDLDTVRSKFFGTL